MKVQEQNQPDMKKVAELIDDMKVCMMTSIVGNRIAARPMTPLELDSEGALWFFSSAASMRGVLLDSINVSFSNESDASYVSMEGHMLMINEPSRKEALWTAFAKPWYPDGPDTPDLVALKLVPRTVDYWNSPSSKVVRMFAMAASVAAGKPIGLGDHEHVAVPDAR